MYLCSLPKFQWTTKNTQNTSKFSYTRWKSFFRGPWTLKSFLKYILNSYLRTFVDFMQNIYAKSHKTFRSFKTSKEFFPDIYAVLHKLLGNKKAKEMLTSAACAHFLIWEGFMHLFTYALCIWISVCAHAWKKVNRQHFLAILEIQLHSPGQKISFIVTNYHLLPVILNYHQW